VQTLNTRMLGCAQKHQHQQIDIDDAEFDRHPSSINLTKGNMYAFATLGNPHQTLRDPQWSCFTQEHDFHVHTAAVSCVMLPTADVRDYVWRTCARLNLPLAWLPDRIAGGRFALEEPPSRPSEWVGDVLRQARVFAQRLEHMRSLDRDDVLLVSLS